MSEDWNALWGRVLRAFHVEDSAENGVPCCGMNRISCPGWYEVCDELMLCSGTGHTASGNRYHVEQCQRAMRWARETGLLNEAPCGSRTCEACFLVLDRSQSTVTAIFDMRGAGVTDEECQMHTVLFAAMGETL